MKLKLRAVLLSLTALLAIGSLQAVAATAASAHPHFSEILPQTFSYVGKEAAVETASSGLQCKTLGGTAEIATFSALTGTLRLQNCTGKISGIPVGSCSSTGAASGEVLTSTLAENLVYMSSARHEIGILFTSNKAGSPIASFKCGTTEEQLKGSVVVKATPISTLTRTFQLTVKGAKGAQEVVGYEGSNGEKLSAQLELSSNGGAYKQADLSAGSLELLASTQTEITG